MADGAAFSVMVGMGETYLPAYVLAMGMGAIAAGLISSIPLLIGAVLQLVSPMAVAKLRSHRRWVILCVVIQGASFIPLVAGALWGTLPVTAVFLVAAVYWGAGLAAGPAWNTWIETVVPFHVRAPFFAWRSRLGQAGVLAGFLVGGLALQYGKHLGHPLYAFAAIFSVAAACRLMSAKFLSVHSEPAVKSEHQRHVSIRKLWRRIRCGGSERMLLYFLAVQVAVQISGPYFTPYMLGQLKVSYLDFMVLLATSFAAKIIALPALGRFACRFSARRLLWIGGTGIVPVAGLWLYAQNFWQLVAIQFIAGSVWAAYELAVFLLFFETIKRDERTSILTTFNLLNSVALGLGALCGGAVLKVLGECPEAYLAIFSLSSAVRAMALLCLVFLSSAAAAKATAKASDRESDPEAGEPPMVMSQLPEPKRPANRGAHLPEPATVSAPTK